MAEVHETDLVLPQQPLVLSKRRSRSAPSARQAPAHHRPSPRGFLRRGRLPEAGKQALGRPLVAKSKQAAREVLLWVTPASGWLPILLPETAGLLKLPRNRATGLRRTWVSSARGCLPSTSWIHSPPGSGRGSGQGCSSYSQGVGRPSWAGRS